MQAASGVDDAAVRAEGAAARTPTGRIRPMTQSKFSSPPSTGDRTDRRASAASALDQGARRGQVFVVAIVVLCAAFMLAFGIWGMASPRSFMQYIDFSPYNRHLVRDAG